MLTTILIAISLSMDAFSLSMAYGTMNISKKDSIILSFIVGIYHFFMPIFGYFLGDLIMDYIPFSPIIIVFTILLLVGIQMIYESFKTDENLKKLDIIGMMFFGLAVSIDSFSIGISNIFDNYIYSSFIISISSIMFTFLGLRLGNRLNKFFGKTATIIGGITLILLAFYYLF